MWLTADLGWELGLLSVLFRGSLSFFANLECQTRGYGINDDALQFRVRRWIHLAIIINPVHPRSRSGKGIQVWIIRIDVSQQCIRIQ
jgi:hypothetical protein